MTQTIAYAASSAAATNAFGSETFQVRLIANSACHYNIGEEAQTATTSDRSCRRVILSRRLSQAELIAAIEASTNGLVTATASMLFVTELS